MDGHAVLWVVLPGLPPPATAAAASDPQHPPEQPPPPPPSPSAQPIDFRLHARQMAIGAVKINGADADFSYLAPPLDLLKKMVPPAPAAAAGVVGGDLDRSGEALDLQYRCRFLAAQDGELGLQLPPGEGWNAERDREEGEVVPKAVLNALSAGNRVSVFRVYIQPSSSL